MKNNEDIVRYLMNLLKLAVFAMILVGIIIFIKLGVMFFVNAKLDDLAHLGDFFGGMLNPIFAFLAFIALLTTIKLQNDALEISKNELQETRKELSKSAKAQEEQSQSLKLQNHATILQMFENTFFQLIALFVKIRDSLSIEICRNKYYERIGLGRGDKNYPYYKCNGIEEKIEEKIEYKQYTGNYEIFSIFHLILKNYATYDAFNSKYEKCTGVYFGQIYQILKFVDDSNIENKLRYINIFRAQFTKDELEFLFYHCLGTIGKRRFKKLVEDYEFFEHIILNEKIENQLLEYDIKVFGKNEKVLEKYNELKNLNP